MANTFNDFSVLFSSYMDLNPGYMHLNNSGVAPMTMAAHRQALEALNIMQEGYHGVPRLIEAYQKARAQVAQLVGVEAGQVAFMQTTAAAISQVAFGLKLRPGDEVVVLSQEYPSNFYPWKIACQEAGASLKVIPCDENYSIPLEQMMAAITPKTRAVTVSWVQYQTGSVVDLQALARACHQHENCWLVVDGIQGLGVIPFNLTEMGVDALCSGSHKWLCGSLGQGILVLAKQHLTSLSPLLHGAFTYGTPDDPLQENPIPRADIMRYEPGSPMILGAVAMGASVEVLLNLEIQNIYEHCQGLCQFLSEGLLARGHKVLSPKDTHSHIKQSSIVTFVPRLDLQLVQQTFKNNNISFALRAGGIRLSPHGFNAIEDLERLLVILDELEANTRSSSVPLPPSTSDPLV